MMSGLRRSGYKQQKAAAAKQNSNKSTYRSCGATHSGYSMQIREQECKAFRVDCRKCGIKEHFERFCNKEKKVAANTAGQTEGAATDTTQQEVRETSAIEFSFFAVKVCLITRSALKSGNSSKEIISLYELITCKSYILPDSLNTSTSSILC